MQTDILLKQVTSSLAELKTAIDKFEKHTPPSTQYTDQLFAAITNSNKLVAAYLVLKEQKDVSPELNLHLKIMNVKETVTEIVPIKEEREEEKLIPVQEEIKAPLEVKPVVVENQHKPIETITPEQSEIISKVYQQKEIPKLSIAINDKFRFINELFSANANEYNIAIEQLNTLSSMEDAKAYTNGLKSIYGWDDENEMVKKLFSLLQKRFS